MVFTMRFDTPGPILLGTTSCQTAKNQADSSTIIALTQPKRKVTPKKSGRVTKKTTKKSSSHFRVVKK